MLHLALLLALAPAPPVPGPSAHPVPERAQEEGKKESEKEREKRLDEEAKVVAENLAEGLKAKEPNERISALVEASETVHERVIDRMAKALRDDEAAVERTVIELFGRMDHPDALEALLKHAKRERKALTEDPERNVALIRAVGLHTDPDTLDWLAKGALEEAELTVRRMRIFAVARQRTPEALERLLTEMRRTERRRLENCMPVLRTGLIWMTGVDRGGRAEDWFAWRREQGDRVELPKDPPRLQRAVEGIWYRAWGERVPERRQRERGDRG